MSKERREFFEKLGLKEYALRLTKGDALQEIVIVYADSLESAISFVRDAHVVSSVEVVN